ncbi:MAG: hypothetical protein A2Y69_14985 [Candidatus Aminicenantes bacterium RBG_13_59_9]|nr:MAG: hypothetical protein A2Y69_14985 [Candidatus Aminicenantes bacterium RBG_13_59_9]
MPADFGQGFGAPEVESEFRGKPLESGGQAFLRRHDPGPRRVFRFAHLERLLGDLNPESGQLRPRGEQGLLPAVFEKKDRPRLQYPSVCLHLPFQRFQGSFQDLFIFDLYRRQSKMDRERPGDIIIGLGLGVFGKFLRGQQVNRIVSIGLVQTDDVTARGEVPFLDRNRLRRPPDLDPLPEEQVDHLGDTTAVALVRRDDESPRLPFDPFLPRRVTLAIKITEQVLAVKRRIVEGGQAAGLHIVDVVPQGPFEFPWRR